VAIGDGNNRISAIPALLDALALDCCIVALDGLGCRWTIAQTLHAQGTDHLLALKAN
jgi:predicted transposase YbfD/YdcC